MSIENSYEINSEIVNYLDDYIKFKYDFMVLLKGEWGSGKTHFIKSYIDYKKSDRFIYISLNGIKKIDDIYQLFIENRYQIRTQTKLLFGVLKSILPITQRIKKNFKIKNLTDFVIKDDMIFIFDDIERVSKDIDISELLGFINRVFIENSNTKVILLSNEDEIIKKWKDNKNEDNISRYNLIKEKSIGKTFEVKEAVESAINSFNNDRSGDTIKEILEQYKDTILEIYNNSSYKNLRILKYTILDFNFYYNKNQEFKEDIDKFKKDEDQIKIFLYIFFISSIEVKKGINDDNDIFNSFFLDNEYFNKSIRRALKNNKNLKNNEEEKEIEVPNRETIRNKYEFNKNNYKSKYYYQLENKDWKNLFYNGSYNKNFIVLDKKEKEWFQLYNFRVNFKLEKSDIKNILEKIKKEDYRFDNIGEIKHIVGILIWGIENKITIFLNNFENKDNILEFAKEKIDKFDNEYLNIININNNDWYLKDNNRPFFEKDNQNFKDILEEIKKYITSIREKEYFDSFKNLIDEISENINNNKEKFDENFNKIKNILESDKIPILIYNPKNNQNNYNIDPQIFIDIIIKFTNYRSETIHIFLNRYHSGLYDDEYNFFKQFFKLYQKEIEKKLDGTIEKYFLNQYINGLKNIIERFEELKNNNKKTN